MVRMGEPGPLRAAWSSTPATGSRSASTTSRPRGSARDLAVSTVVELRAGERFVRVRHRRQCLRGPSAAGVVPAARPGAHVHGRVRLRDRHPRPRRRERSVGDRRGGLPFPSLRTGGWLTITHEGLPEYELVDIQPAGAATLALTLLRATRFLSRGPMATRRLPAGPILELRGAQVPGRRVLRYAVAIGAVDPYRLADDAWVDLGVAGEPGSGRWARSTRRSTCAGPRSPRCGATRAGWSCGRQPSADGHDVDDRRTSGRRRRPARAGAGPVLRRAAARTLRHRHGGAGRRLRSASPRPRVSDHAGSSPELVSAISGAGQLPEQRRSLAVPAHRRADGHGRIAADRDAVGLDRLARPGPGEGRREQVDRRGVGVSHDDPARRPRPAPTPPPAGPTVWARRPAAGGATHDVARARLWPARSSTSRAATSPASSSQPSRKERRARRPMSSATTTASSSHGSTVVPSRPSSATATRKAEPASGGGGPSSSRAQRSAARPTAGATSGSRRSTPRPACAIHPRTTARAAEGPRAARRRPGRRGPARRRPSRVADRHDRAPSAGRSTPSTGTVDGRPRRDQVPPAEATATPAGERFSSSITVRPPPSTTA